MLLFAQTVCFFSVSSWVWLRGLDFPEISAAVCPVLQKQRSPPSRPGQQWSACPWVSPFCPASIPPPPNVYSVLCFPSRSWNHAGSWEADRGRLRVPLRPQLPGPLPVDQPTAGRPEDVWQTRPVLQDSQHVLCYALLGNHADGRLKQEVQAGRSHSCALKFAVISKVPMICRPPCLQEALQLPWRLCSEQTGPGSVHVLPAGAADGRWLPGDRQRRGPRHGGHGAVRQPVEPRAGGKEARGQDNLQGNLFNLKCIYMFFKISLSVMFATCNSCYHWPFY